MATSSSDCESVSAKVSSEPVREKPKRGALPTPEAIPKMKAEKLAKCLKDYGRAHPNVANAVFLRDDRSSPDSIGSALEDAGPAAPPTTLGDLPPELAAHILSLAAPRCPLYRAVEDAVLEANARGAADVALAIDTGEGEEAH